MEPESSFAGRCARSASACGRQRSSIVSAHWQTQAPEVRATGAERPPLIYDFGGFPDEMYRLTYPAPGAPALARELVDALAGAHASDGTPQWAAALDETRGWDHGAWVPLRLAYPAADVPVVQLSLPTASPPALLALGRVLAPFRARDVLVIGSGTVVHNLGAIGRGGGAGGGAGWAHAFDAWFADVVARHDLEELAAWRVRAPQAALAHPTNEHFDPFLIADRRHRRRRAGDRAPRRVRLRHALDAHVRRRLSERAPPLLQDERAVGDVAAAALVAGDDPQIDGAAGRRQVLVELPGRRRLLDAGDVVGELARRREPGDAHGLGHAARRRRARIAVEDHVASLGCRD